MSLSEDTASFCAITHHQSQPNIALYHEVPTIQWQKELVNWVNKNKIGNALCGVSIGTHAYNVYQVEKPQVPDNELRQALSWPVKEMSSGDNREMTFDYFDSPAQVAGRNNVNVSLVAKEDIDAIITATMDAGLQLTTISVEELTNCEILPVTEEPVMTLLQRAGEEIQLAIIKSGALYFSRSLKGFENLGSFSIEELKMGVMDSLTVQLQRSMDYFEGQLRQAPVRKILFNIEASNSTAIGQQIADIMRLDVEPFELDVTSEVGAISGMNFQCIGAALMAFNEQRNATGSAA
ncbi:MSHA biogenesis protein MshI [Alteromonas sp. ASW11-36]|uniref:MSHA biogenesis protein MshI n=1 Tax=Alteromonas arenosi TaxID=3055817 RepID=A0ABT7SSH5_9ALTE|nr:MSHA biogenesis protein MshI [Alteromonas sp. ASW11-36]MDM7859150.1 MSHA biogenesis protein MshI [Alteromonas sp. ASW11-36]